MTEPAADHDAADRQRPTRQRSPGRPRRKLGRFLLLAVIAVPTMWVLGFAWFGFTMPDNRGALPKADAIVVLTGGADRVAAGLKFLAEQRAPALLISGVHPAVKKVELIRLANQPRPDLAGRVYLGYRAQDTEGNATEAAAWVRKRKVRTLIVVTANYHLRRSLLELRQELPGVRLIPAPVFPDAVPAAGWWRSWQGLRIVATEYNKFLAAWLRSVAG